ncbi:MAG: hypothetical protein RL112_1968 [Planctomycetota bacterium]
MIAKSMATGRLIPKPFARAAPPGAGRGGAA